MKQSSENLNIALVHDWLTNHSGGERVLYELSLLFPKAPIFTSVYDPQKTKYFDGKTVNTSFLQNVPFFKSKRELLVPFTPFAFEQFDLGKYDLVISSSSMAAKGVITKPETTHICYCHTPARYLWEPTIDSRADKGMFGGLRKNVAHQMRIWDRLAADRVDFFIANSKYVAKRIKKYYQRESKVVYPPIDTSRFAVSKSENIENYFLFVSRLVNYKNCDLVIQAFNDLGLPLKIIGQGPEKTRLQKMAKPNIEFLGFLSDNEVKEYYSRAKAFIFAAEEDFGIVPVEAMASGRPVIAYGAGGVLESVLSGKTGELFPELTPQCLADTVAKFRANQYDSQFIRNHAEKFDRVKFVENFLTIVEDIIK